MNGRINFLDGLRGWSCLVVLLNHTVQCFLAVLPNSDYLNQIFFSNFFTQSQGNITKGNYLDFLISFFLKLFCDGYLAVLIFFVLSGFALSTNHLDGNKKLAFATTSRYFRLVIPIAFTSFFAYLLLKFGFMCNREAAVNQQSKDWLGSFYNFEANFLVLLKFSFYDVFFNYNPKTSYNAILWTMPIEMLGSFCIYTYLGIYSRLEKAIWSIVVPIIIWLMLFNDQHFITCFFLGYVIAEIHKKCKNINHKLYGNKVQILIILAFIITLILSVYFRESDKLTTLFAGVIVFSATFSIYLKKIFTLKISEFLGRISFPLYLIQIPIICSFSSYLIIKLPFFGFNSASAYLITLIATMMLCLFASILLLPIEKLSIYCSKKLAIAIINRA